MKRIAIDMDEVIADVNPKLLNVFNKEYNEQITMEDLKGKSLEDLKPEYEKEIINYLHNPLWFRDLAVIKDSQEVIKELSYQYEIFITTAAMEFPPSFTAKYEWLKENFSFISELNYVFCGDKSIIKADYLIDDHFRHFKRFSGQGVLFTSPHNIHETGYIRVNNWKEVREYFLR